MQNTYRYLYPQDVFHASILERIDPQQRTLMVTANRQHAQWLRQQLQHTPHGACHVLTLQAFLLRAALRSKFRRILSATARGVFVARAWSSVNGAHFQRYGQHTGAIREVGSILSWISQQRRQWRHPDPQLELQSEYVQTYHTYCALVDRYEYMGYDDVALHVCDGEVLPATHDALHVYELQYAQPAQLHALAHLSQAYTHVTTAAWIPEQVAAPELHDVAEWLAQNSPPLVLTSPTAPLQRQLADRIDGKPVPVPALALTGTASDTLPWRAGCTTSIDECHTVIQQAISFLQKQRHVDIICADDAQVPLLQRMFQQYGVTFPHHAPPTQHNPLIQFVRAMLRWGATADEAYAQERVATISYIAQLPFLGHYATEATAISGDPQHPTHQRICHWGERFIATENIEQAIRQLLNESGALQWCWQHDSIPVDVRDSWLRDMRKWLYQIREMMAILTIDGPIDATQWGRILDIDVLPTTTQTLTQNTLPLRIHGRQGYHEAHDVAIIMGLSEHTGPLPMPDWQLCDDAELQAMWRRPVTVPAWRDHTAWRERETRRFQRMLATHAQTVILSFAYYDTAGKAQLPSGFLEHLLGQSITMTRNGEIDAIDPTLVCIPSAPVPAPTPRVPATERHIPILDRPVFSASQIRRYLTCPKQYYYEYILRLANMADDESDTRTLDLGSLIHELCCAILGNGQTRNVVLLGESLATFHKRIARLRERAATAFEAAWDGTPTTLPGGDSYTPTTAWHHVFGDGLRQHSSRRHAERMLERWVEHEIQLVNEYPNRRPVLLEQRVEFTIANQRFVAQIDRIDSIYEGTNRAQYVAIDYKTSGVKSYSDLFKEFVQEDISQLANMQIPLYLLAFHSPTWDITPSINQMSIVYLNDQKSDTVIPRHFYVHNNASGPIKQGRSHVGYHINSNTLFVDIPTQLTVLMQQMSRTPYPTRPDFHCKYCAFTLICDDATP